MNTFVSYLRVTALVVCALVFSAAAAQAQTAAFTYQGQLNDGAMAANGTYQMQFSLFDAATGGNQIGATITNTSVTVASGVFTVTLDFSPATPFATGAARYLQIAVKKPAEANYTLLDPRQQITSAPYAIRTISAGAADTLSANCVSCVTNGQINSVDGAKVTGGAAIANLNASNLASGTVPLARLGTNAPTAATFLRGDNTWASVAGLTGVTLQVSATNTAAQTITPLAGSGQTQNVSFNNIITAPTAGTFDGTTFTATAAGTYLITVAVTPFRQNSNSQIGTLIQLTVNGTIVTHGTYSSSLSFTDPSARANSTISMTLALNANDAVLVRGASFSTSAPSPISTDGTTRLAIVRLN